MKKIFQLMLFSIFILFPFTNLFAQGSSCTSAQGVIPGSSCVNSTFIITGVDYWLRFTASDQNAIINIRSTKFAINGPHVHKATLFDGTCGSLSVIEEEELSHVDPAEDLRISANGLTIGNIYYIKLERDVVGKPCPRGMCSIGAAPFDICIKNVRVYIPDDGVVPSSSSVYFQNKGQILNIDGTPNTDIKSFLNNHSPEVYLTDDNPSFVYYKSDTIPDDDSAFRFDMKFVNGNPSMGFEAEKTESKLHYYLGHAKEGIVDLKGFQRMVYQNIYSNIDFQTYSKSTGELAYYFIIQPGGNLDDIKLKFEGATSTSVSSNKKQLTITTPAGDMILIVDEAYRVQPNGSTNPRNVRFKDNGGTIGFDVNASINGGDVLVIRAITPVLFPLIQIRNHWSTYIGGNVTDGQNSITLDANNNVYTCGYTNNSAFPVTAGIFATFNGTMDATITKFNPNRGMSWSAFFGGAGNDRARSITYIQPSGVVAFTGETSSDPVSFPLFDGGGYYRDLLDAPNKLFVAKLNAAGNLNLWTTYFGVSSIITLQEVHDMTSDLLGNIYIGGVIEDINGTFPTQTLTGAYSQTYHGGGNDAFISKFDPTNELVWSTFLGGDNGAAGLKSEEVNGMTTDVNGNLYVTGTCGSFGTVTPSPCISPLDIQNFPLVDPGNGAYIADNMGGAGDAYIAKFNVSGAIVWSTLIGGSSTEIWSDAAHNYDGVSVCKNTGDIYIVGSTVSTDFPTMNVNPPVTGVYFQPAHAGGTEDAFIVKFNSTYNLKYSTYYGGNGSDYGIAVDVSDGNKVFVSGSTSSTNFPLKTQSGNYHQGTLGGGTDSYMIELDANTRRLWSTYYGGSLNDRANGIVVDALANNIITCGETSSSNFPVADPVGNLDWSDISYNASGDGFISNFRFICIICPNRSMMEEGLEEDVKTGGSKVYPNPSNGIFNLVFENDGTYIVEIYNTLGEVLETRTFTGTKALIVLPESAKSGIYFLRAIGESEIFSHTLIKE